MNLRHVLRLLSKIHAGERDVSVLLRKHTQRYVDEENWRSMAPAWIEAERRA